MLSYVQARTLGVGQRPVCLALPLGAPVVGSNRLALNRLSPGNRVRVRVSASPGCSGRTRPSIRAWTRVLHAAREAREDPKVPVPIGRPRKEALRLSLNQVSTILRGPDARVASRRSHLRVLEQVGVRYIFAGARDLGDPFSSLSANRTLTGRALPAGTAPCAALCPPRACRRLVPGHAYRRGHLRLTIDCCSCGSSSAVLGTDAQ